MAGGWHGDECFKEKICPICDTMFKPKSGVHKFCSEKCKGKWQYVTGQSSTENQYKNISGNWYRYFSRLCNRSNKRESISVEDLLGILEKQDYKCALSGIQLTCKLEKGVKYKTNASLDRIDAGGPYIKENIQIVCSALNSFRSDTNCDEFIWWCKKVAEYNND